MTYTGKAGEAYRLGSVHAYAERMSWDVLGDDAETLLDAIGETSATTYANVLERDEMCLAYLDGFDDARSELA